MLLRIDVNIGWLKKKSDEGVRVVRLVEKWVASAGMACVKASAPSPMSDVRNEKQTVLRVAAPSFPAPSGLR